MSWNTSRGISKIPPKVRDRADGSIVSTVSANMRYACIRVTMDMVRDLESMSHGERFDCTVRGLMMIAYGVPIKVMCVGLYPYEQNILPPIATALAYSAINCNGPTPSVQILAQAMASVGVTIKDKLRNRRRNKDAFEDVTESMLMARFTMLL
ncbi:hypothetical protein LTR16_008492, partial [Cryomyces antarcticus]